MFCWLWLGSQALALKYLKQDGFKIDFEHWKICEWAIPSIIAYASVHRDELNDYGKDFTEGLTKEDIANELYRLGVSINYNEPAKLEQLKRMPDDKLRVTYNSIKWEHNLVNIATAKGVDLEITNTDKYDYLLTYSFP